MLTKKLSYKDRWNYLYDIFMQQTDLGFDKDSLHELAEEYLWETWADVKPATHLTPKQEFVEDIRLFLSLQK